MVRNLNKYRFNYSFLFWFTFLALNFFFIFNSFAATQVSFAWDPNNEPDLAGYRVFYREEGQSYDFDFPDWEGTETTCTIYGLDENTTYYFVARAYDIYGNESENSIELSSADAGGTYITTNADAGGTSITTSEGGGGGCFIATAAFGSYIEPHVKILRDFRDRFLIGNTIGDCFVRLYYTYSPPVANIIAEHDSLRALVRIALLPVVGLSWVALKLGLSVTIALSLFLGICMISVVRFRKITRNREFSMD